jgi:CDP-glycerol glycerophosphotransferase (TagB/SpsB family)
VTRASFTFAAGNAAKLLRLPLMAAGDGLSRLVPRDPRRVVIGSAFGYADGAAALERALRACDRPPRVTWLLGGEDPRELPAGLARMPKGGRRGWWATARAGHVVVTHGFGDVNRYAVGGAHVVQLWHGTPLKRLHLDSPAALRLPVVGGRPAVRRAVATMYRLGTRRIALIPAASARSAESLASAFGVPAGAVQVLGEPRTDILFAGPQEARVAEARRRLEAAVGDLGGRRVVLFAPTWRDGDPDPGIPGPGDWAAIEAWCTAHGCVLVLRPHPLSVGDYSHASDQVRLLDPGHHREVIPVLWAVDALVTDYSSIVVDHAVTGRPTVFLAPDEAAYLASRGLYRPYAEITGGQVARDWSGVLERLTAVLGADDAAAGRAVAHAHWLASEYHEHRDGGSARRVAAAMGFGTNASTVASGEKVAGEDPAVVRRTVTRSRASAESGPRSAFFESYHGASVACNPRAIDAVLADRLPGLVRQWSVASPDTPIPEGAVAVVRGTAEWRRARDEADLVCINDWVEDGWRPRRDQFLLQTWHGTPLKRLALSRGPRSLRESAAVLKQSTRWDALLAQSPEAAGSLGRAYAVPPWRRWTLGYPRNDQLVTSRGPADLDARLGIGTARVVLYAPTWRDADLGSRPPLDPEALAAELGPDWTVLVRGHSRTIGHRDPAAGARVVDVTLHPDASDVLARADVLVTDYSSVMFDFSATGRPMVFHQPDLAEYVARSRGLLWDPATRVPGPVTRTVAECAEAVASAESDAGRWQGRYVAWRAAFNPLDDGSAAARVVDRLLSPGRR